MPIDSNNPAPEPGSDFTLAGLKRWFLDAFEPGRGRLPIGLLSLAALLALIGVILFVIGVAGRPQTDGDGAFVTSSAPEGADTLVAFPLDALKSRPGQGTLVVTGDEGQQITVATAKRSDFDAWKTAVAVHEITGFDPDDNTKFAVKKTTPTAGVTLADLRNLDLWTSTQFKSTEMKLTAKEINSANAPEPLVVVAFAESKQSVKELSMQWPNPNATKKSNGQMWGGGILTLLGLALLGYIAWDRHQSTVPALQRQNRRGSRTPQSAASGGGTILPGTEPTAADEDRQRHGGQIPGSNVSLTDAATAPHQAVAPHTAAEGTPAAAQSHAADVSPAATQDPSGAAHEQVDAGQPSPEATQAGADWLQSNTVHHVPEEVRQAYAEHHSPQPGADQQPGPGQQPAQPGVGNDGLTPGTPRPVAPQSTQSPSSPAQTPQPPRSNFETGQSAPADSFFDSTAGTSPQRPSPGAPGHPEGHSAPRRDPGPRPQPSTSTHQWSTNLQPGGDLPDDEYQLPPISAQELLDGRTGAIDQIDPSTGRPVDPNQQLPRPARNTKDDPNS